MKKISLFLMLLHFSATFAHAQGNTFNDNFDKSKRLLLKIHVDLGLGDFYCGAKFDDAGQITDFNGYQFKKDTTRAHRIEWDHVVPAENFGQSFKAWRDGDPACVDTKGKPLGNRDCAEKMSPEYRYMQADMYNLRPAVGEMNASKSNNQFAMIGMGDFEFGACQVRNGDGKFEPPPNVRGDVARIFLYMDTTYPNRGVISEKNRKLFAAWNKEDPVDANECALYERIKKLQGNENPIMQAACAGKGQPATPRQAEPKPEPTPKPEPVKPTKGDCNIKGNIDAKGNKVYYLPGDPGYGSVKIDESQGERLFCSEKEAQKAGWQHKD